MFLVFQLLLHELLKQQRLVLHVLLLLDEHVDKVRLLLLQLRNGLLYLLHLILTA